MSNLKPKGAVIDPHTGWVHIINGTSCDQRWCAEYGCDFPNCATFSDECFKNKKEALEKYPDLEFY